MTPKWKAVTIWAMLPYFSLTLIAFAYALLRAQGSLFLTGFFDWKVQAVVLLPCVGASGFGTLLLWSLPIRRKWLGILAGLMMGLAAVTLGAWIDMQFWGGFEEDGALFLAALVLAGPSCAAGAYAGFLRAQDQARGKRPDADGWWPSPSS